MKRINALPWMVAVLMTVGLAAAHADDRAVPPHGHVLILGAVYVDGDLVDFAGCVDLANGRSLRTDAAHHANAHTGSAGDALRTRAGHLVAPTFDFDGCAELEAFFGK